MRGSLNIKEDIMDFHEVALAVAVDHTGCIPVLAQSIGTEVQRDINQGNALNRV